jgi:ankyrin repeat protein
MKKVLVAVILPVVVLSLSLLAAGQATSGLDTQLLEAAKAGDAAAVQQLLQKGAHIEAKDDYGDTALIVAAEKGHSDVVKLLLEKGANIEAKNEVGATALIMAAAYGKTDMVKLLLEKGANFNAKYNRNDTALMAAAIRFSCTALLVPLATVAAQAIRNSAALRSRAVRPRYRCRRHRLRCGSGPCRNLS